MFFKIKPVKELDLSILDFSGQEARTECLNPL